MSKQTAVEWLWDISQEREINAFDFEQAKAMEKEQSELKIDKITRLEVINHAKNDKSIGRLLTMYKELNDFNSIELSFQDGGRTLKIFLD